MKTIRPAGLIGADVPRIDGVAKVTGAALYGDDQPTEGAAYAYLKTSDIALGKIRTIDEARARQVPGLLEIFTHCNVGSAVKPGKGLLQGGSMSTTVAPLASQRVHFCGQIVAIAVAETFEAAREAAMRIEIEYETEQPTASLEDPGANEVKAKTINETRVIVGQFEQAFQSAPVKVEEWYHTPPQHHNPLELFQTTCAWDGENLTVWESSQNVNGFKHGLALQLGIKPKQVRVLSPFIGGAFGSRGELAQSTALIALAAKRLGRPVKLVASRRQGFTLRTFRAETKHHIHLGAERDGILTALSHKGWELTSRSDRFSLAGIEATLRLYGCANLVGDVRNVEADRQTPGFMRAPPEIPYMFALESAMDELAWKLNLDPIELRKRNDTMHEPVKGLPYSSRSLKECFDAAGEAFGWKNREMRIGSMHDGDWLIGWGCATAVYPAQIAPAHCRVTLAPDARVTVETGAHDIGTGAYTIIVQTAADQLGLPMERVTVLLGDSDLPAAPLTAGSSATASICTVVAKACQEIRRKLAKAAVKTKQGSLHGLDPTTILMKTDRLVAPTGEAEPLLEAIHRVGKGNAIVVNATNNPDGSPPLIGPMLIRKGKAIIIGGSNHRHHVQYAFGAQLVEVRVHRLTGEIRVPRAVGAFACGRIMNPRTAKSQLLGGQVWGISSALLEATEMDHRTARYVNSDLADYLIPVNADIQQITTIMIPETDTLVNPLGIKGVGEIGIVGLNAAIANAVYHATGVRIRSLPIRIDAPLLAALDPIV